MSAPAVTARYRFEMTEDMEAVRRINTHPQIYPHVTSDDSPPVDQFRPLVLPGGAYVLAFEEGILLGCFLLHPVNATDLQAHISLLPNAWGIGVEIVRELFRWIWDISECRRIVAHVPVYNRLALRLSQKAGMLEYGRKLMSFQKNGQMFDEIMLEISRPEVR